MNTEQTSTITVSEFAADIASPGSDILIYSDDTRWWVRLWCWIRRKPSPQIATPYTVTDIPSSTTLTIKPKGKS